MPLISSCPGRYSSSILSPLLRFPILVRFLVYYALNDSQCIAYNYSVCGMASNCPRSLVFLMNFAAFNTRAGAPNTFLRSRRSLVLSLSYVSYRKSR